MISCNKQDEYFTVTIDGYRDQCREELAALIGSIYTSEMNSGLTEKETIDHITDIANKGIRIGRETIKVANKDKE